MIEVVTVDEMLRLEADVNLPEQSLMRTAAFGLYVEILDIARENFGSAHGLRVLGLIGPGNNGSDALWAMSLLARHGMQVVAIDVTGKRSRGFVDELYLSNAGTWKDIVEISFQVDLIIDGIAGLRNQYPPDEQTLSLLSEHPESVIVAVDMPSCFNNNQAELIDENQVMFADYTVTFGYLKSCHVFDPARSLCGEVRLIELPVASPDNVVARFMEQHDVSGLLNQFDTEANKYSHGVLGVVAGSHAYLGAGELTLRGSQWGGAGYIQYIGPGQSLSPSNVVRVEGVSDLHEKTDTVVFGPGVGTHEDSKHSLETLLHNSQTLVLDADAITVLAQNPGLLEKLTRRTALTILTPHHGEAIRLADALAINTDSSIHRWVSEIAKRLNALVSYKSAHGFVALPDGTFLVCESTSSALATAGTGDVLSGLMGSLIARNNPKTPYELGKCAIGSVIIHSLAAQLALDEGVNPTALDIALQIRNAIAILEGTQ